MNAASTPPTRVLSTKADIEALRADVFKALTDQTWKVGAVVLSGLGLLLAVLKFH